MLPLSFITTIIQKDQGPMGDFLEQDEADVLTADVDVHTTNDNSLYVPNTWTDACVADFEQAIALLPQEKRGVTMLKTRFGNFKRHYELLGRDSASLQKTVDYINGVRSHGARKTGVKSLVKAAKVFFTGMSEQLLYKQAKIYGLNPAMYADNEALIEALVTQHVSAHSAE